MFKQPLYRTLGIVGVGIVALIGVVSGQASRTIVPTGMDELLAEVRGLRVEINQAATTSIRMQVLVARVGLQEQRINVVAKQLADVRQQLPGTDPRLAVEIDRIEEELRRAVIDSKERKAMEDELPGMKAALQQQLSRQQALRSQEAELSALLATEQARWTEFNDRLDVLERSLTTQTSR
jgi:hypothetical protein